MSDDFERDWREEEANRGAIRRSMRNNPELTEEERNQTIERFLTLKRLRRQTPNRVLYMCWRHWITTAGEWMQEDVWEDTVAGCDTHISWALTGAESGELRCLGIATFTDPVKEGTWAFYGDCDKVPAKRPK